MLPKLRLSKGDWGVVISAAVAYVVQGALSLRGTVISWWIWPLTAVGAAAILYGKIQGLSKYRGWKIKKANQDKADTKATVEQGIKKILSLIVEAVPEKVPARANVMLVDENDELYIAYQHRMEGAPDLAKRWGKNVGSCGDAWVNAKQRVAELEQADEQTLEITWKMDAQHRKVTSDVKSILSTPIRSVDNRDIIIGILNCDSSEGLSASRLDEGKFRATAQKYADTIASFLKLGELSKRED